MTQNKSYRILFDANGIVVAFYLQNLIDNSILYLDSLSEIDIFFKAEYNIILNIV